MSGGTPRVVLIGASNVTRGLSVIIDHCHRLLGKPLEIFAALGYGRSYGLTSRVLGRGLPSIRDCGLWSALKASGPGKTFAILTDIGNDIAYEAPPQEIVRWIEIALERLAEYESRITIGLLPLENLRTLGNTRFLMARSLLFPGRRITLPEVIERAEYIDGKVRELAGDIGATTIEPRKDWYGIDPIHITRRHMIEAWFTYVTPWLDETSPEDTGKRMPLRSRISLSLMRPEHYTILNWKRGRQQPCGTLPGGSRVWMF